MRRLAIILVAASLAGVGTGRTLAEGYEDTIHDQGNLVWTSGYQGPLSGRMGPRAREAVSRLQGALGTLRTGVLTDYERGELEGRAAAEKRRLGWRMRLDEPTGIRIGLPENLLDGARRKKSGTEYMGKAGAFLLQTMVSAAADASSLRDNMEKVIEAVRSEGYATTYMTYKDDWFVVNASKASAGMDVYVRMHLVGPWVKGYMLFTRQAGADVGAMVPAVSLSLQPDAEEPRYRPPAQPVAPPPSRPATEVAAKPSDQSSPPEPRQATGSGFVVAPGKLLTNHHVVKGCANVSVAGIGPATVFASDTKNDLAIVDVPGMTAKPLIMASDAARLGEDVVAMGYPFGTLLGNRLNITQGIVSSTEGLLGDWTNLQIAVPVQPGNSGGPLLDLEGRVRGVVVSKLKASVVASMTGHIPEQVNFAVKGEVAKGFLKGNGVAFLEAASLGKGVRQSTADIAEGARPSVLQVVCR